MTTTNIETDILYQGKVEISMEDYEKLSTEEENTDYELIDFPYTGITNSQMIFALTCTKLFPDGASFICIDSGTYIQGHTYKIVVSASGTKSWEDITPVTDSDVNSVDENSNYYAADATKTSSDKFSIVIGPDGSSNGIGNIIVGAKADGPADKINSDGTITPASAVVIGNYATTSVEATRAIVIGANARSEAPGAIQLGMGTNSTENSVQFFNDNIYKKDTKTFTMQNLTVGGNNVYGLLKGEGAPAETLVGKVGQQYQDITNKKLYYCTAASSENNVYKWQLLQTEITQNCEETTSIMGETATVARFGNLVIQTITFTSVTGNSEKTWTFPKTFDKILIWDCNCVQEGQSVNNGASVITHSESSMTVRVCGAASEVTFWAVGICLS